MQMIYLAMKHPEHLYSRGAHLEAGTVEEAFDNRKAAADFVAKKNEKATCSYWSVKAKRVKSGALDAEARQAALEKDAALQVAEKPAGPDAAQ